MTSLITLVREGTLDAELGALVWLLAEGGVPVHVAARDASAAVPVAEAVRPLAAAPEAVSFGGGGALDEVLRQPVPLRPATGAVLIVEAGRVVAAHLQRPPLRDAGGHIHPQGPAVLATWEPSRTEWEHFAWGIIPELAATTGRKAGDFEIEHARRREYLAAVAGAASDDPAVLDRALRGYRVGRGREA